MRIRHKSKNFQRKKTYVIKSKTPFRNKKNSDHQNFSKSVERSFSNLHRSSKRSMKIFRPSRYNKRFKAELNKSKLPKILVKNSNQRDKKNSNNFKSKKKLVRIFLKQLIKDEEN